MTGEDRARRLLAYAGETLDELKTALARGSWNRCVRKAQEVVELTLKAALLGAGVDPAGRPGRHEHSVGRRRHPPHRAQIAGAAPA